MEPCRLRAEEEWSRRSRRAAHGLDGDGDRRSPRNRTRQRGERVAEQSRGPRPTVGDHPELVDGAVRERRQAAGGEHRLAGTAHKQGRVCSLRRVAAESDLRFARLPGPKGGDQDCARGGGDRRRPQQPRAPSPGQRDHLRAGVEDAQPQRPARPGRLDRERQRGRGEAELLELALAVRALRQMALERFGFVVVEGVEGERGCLLVHHAYATWGRARRVIARPRPSTTTALNAGRSRIAPPLKSTR